MVLFTKKLKILEKMMVSKIHISSASYATVTGNPIFVIVS